MSHKQLGKIQKANVGRGGGGPDTLFGITFQLGGEGWGVGAWKRMDTPDFGPWLKDTLMAAKVNSIKGLEGVPIEVTFDQEFGMLQSWRVLEEVL